MRYLLVVGVILAVLVLIVVTVLEPQASELPPEILACITDIECKLAADALCEQGDLEWCIEEA